MTKSAELKSAESQKIPYIDELTSIKKEIHQLDINYTSIESNCISKMLQIRDENENKAFRITSIVKNDYLSDKKPMNKKYLATYLHDKVLDVTCNYFQRMGFSTNKEVFISEYINNRPIKGHADIVFNNKCRNYLGEVKNYLESTVGIDEFRYFIHQLLAYSYFLNIKTAFLIINNPKRYINVTVFKVNINQDTEKYIKEYINRSLNIPDYIDTFKYNKSN